MSKGKSSLRKIDRTAFNHANNQKKVIIGPQRITQSLLDVMADGREFESLLQYKPSPDMNIANEIRRSIAEIESIRQRPLICYMANIVNPRIIASKSIDNNDDLPFSEMVDVVLPDSKEVDIVLVTPGGSGQQVAKFVDRLRPRFDKVSFILPNMAMSAGTIFAMSGDEIIMDPRSYIGPIDPQIPNKDGNFMPAQAILTLIDEIQKRGETLIKSGMNPLWTDLQILRQIDGKEIGNAISASAYSVELVENYLYHYKFKTWLIHSKDGRPVTDEEKKLELKALQIFYVITQYGKHTAGE